MIGALTSALIISALLTVSSYKKGELVTYISECYYYVGIIFTISMIAVSLLILPFALELMPTNFEVIAFIMCGALAYVGVAAQYQKSEVYKIHYISALLAMICSIGFVCLIQPLILLWSIVLFIGLIDKNRWLLYIELMCLGSVFTALIL